MRPRKEYCGTNGTSVWPRARRRRLAASGGPCRTAKTPALGRGYSSTAATSPAAKTPGQSVDSSVGCTAMKPAASRARPVSCSHGCARPCVHQIASSYSTASPSAQCSAVGVVVATSLPSSSSTPRSAITRAKTRRTPSECCGISCADRETWHRQGPWKGHRRQGPWKGHRMLRGSRRQFGANGPFRNVVSAFSAGILGGAP